MHLFEERTSTVKGIKHSNINLTLHGTFDSFPILSIIKAIISCHQNRSQRRNLWGHFTMRPKHCLAEDVQKATFKNTETKGK
jgi:hypothetical protein